MGLIRWLTRADLKDKLSGLEATVRALCGTADLIAANQAEVRTSGDDAKEIIRLNAEIALLRSMLAAKGPAAILVPPPGGDGKDAVLKRATSEVLPPKGPVAPPAPRTARGRRAAKDETA